MKILVTKISQVFEVHFKGFVTLQLQSQKKKKKKKQKNKSYNCKNCRKHFQGASGKNEIFQK